MLHRTLTVLTLTAMWISADARADAPGEALRDRVIQAYRDINDYQSQVAFEVNQTRGRWRMTQAADLHVALDRDDSRLTFDKPDLRLVIDQGLLKLNSPELPGRHLETAAPAVELEAISEAVPVMGQPLSPDLVFLTAKDPIAVLGGTGEVTVAETIEARPGLTIPVENGTMTLRLNAKTHLIESATQTVDVAAMGGAEGDAMVLTFTIDAKSGQASGDEAFAFDTTGSTAAGSLQELVGGGAGGAAAEPMGQNMAGQDAPPIELNTLDGQAFKLADAKEKVIVLDFWATWCPPCVEALPKLQSVYDWAKAKGKDVAIYAVNLQELPEQVKDFWAKKKLTMPVLMDTEGKAAGAYEVQSIPQTFVISGGKIAHVHVGFDRKMDETLKAEIDALLAAE